LKGGEKGKMSSQTKGQLKDKINIAKKKTLGIL
jgi:hypothetical protein